VKSEWNQEFLASEGGSGWRGRGERRARGLRYEMTAERAGLHDAAATRHGHGGGHRFFGHGGGRGPQSEGHGGGRGRGRGGGDGGGHRGRGGRYFGRGDLRLVLLSLIAEKPRHGYDLIRAIAESTGGVYRPSPGVIYPTLALLEDLGHLRTSVDADQRRQHEITAEGRAFLDAHRVSLAGMQSRIPGRRPLEVEAQVREVRMAMEQLKQALRATLAGGPVEAARLARIVATIEQAARDVAGSEAS